MDSSDNHFFSDSFGGCAGCLGFLLMRLCSALLVTIVGMFVAQWICNIDPGTEYVWYSGIWHGLFVVPNFVRGLFDADVLCFATLHTTAYTVWWWITAAFDGLVLLAGVFARS